MFVPSEEDLERMTKILNSRGRKRARLRVYTGLPCFSQDDFSVERNSKNLKNKLEEDRTKLSTSNALNFVTYNSWFQEKETCALSSAQFVSSLKRRQRNFGVGLLVGDLARSGRTSYKKD